MFIKFFILINNNKRILPTLKSRCLNFKIQLTSNQSIDIANKILNNNYNEFVNYLISNKYKLYFYVYLPLFTKTFFVLKI